MIKGGCDALLFYFLLIQSPYILYVIRDDANDALIYDSVTFSIRSFAIPLAPIDFAFDTAVSSSSAWTILSNPYACVPQ